MFGGCIILSEERLQQVCGHFLSQLFIMVYLFLHLYLGRQDHCSFNHLSGLMLTIPNEDVHSHSFCLGIIERKASPMHADEVGWQLGESLLKDYLLMTHHLLDVESVLFGFAFQWLDSAKHCLILGDVSSVHTLPHILDRQLMHCCYSFNEVLRCLDFLVGTNLVIVVLLPPELFLLFGRFLISGHRRLNEFSCHRSELFLYFVSGLSFLDLSVKLLKLSVVECLCQ